MATIGTKMVENDLTARQIFEQVMADPARPRFGFGNKLAVINIDFQNAYTRIDEFPTAFEADPRQIEYVNRISGLARDRGMPVIWTHVAYMGNAADAGIWKERTTTPESVQNIRYGSRRHDFDERCEIDPSSDVIYDKRMPSAFFETPLPSLLVRHQVDTVVITGGSTSGCIRATAVDSLSRGYRTIVPIETCADRHASFHYANLTDLQLKYADVESVQVVIDWLSQS
ncbi:isochorismatase family protein [Sphingomonas hengshuiensis]|nr:isochorismatase family protein [Sphingomonas hengshuiensis]